MATLGYFERLAHQRVLKRWARFARRADRTPLEQLQLHRSGARDMRVHLDQLIHTADERLDLPAINASPYDVPHNADWAWRPQLWRGGLPFSGMASVQNDAALGDEIKVFHDCPLAELSLRQVRNQRPSDSAAYGLRMDVFQFAGAFMSLVLDLPPDATEGLRRNHLVRLDPVVEIERPIEIFARLNIQHGPNVEQLVRELPLHQSDHAVEFDLAYSNMNEKRAEKAWLDLIFEGPAMNQVTVRDVVLSRRPRAEL
ncbi:MAG: DUF6478 family protein [Pseudomonadota bacterium]